MPEHQGTWRRTCSGPHPYPEPEHPRADPARRCFCKDCEAAGQRWAWGLPQATSEVGASGVCRFGHPVTSLHEVVAEKLTAAGIAPDDPGLKHVRSWNASVAARNEGQAAQQADRELAS